MKIDEFFDYHEEVSSNGIFLTFSGPLDEKHSFFTLKSVI